MLEEQLFPLLKRKGQLSEEEVEKLSLFEEKLLDAEDAENLDLPIAAILSERLFQDAMAKGDLLPKLRRMDQQLSVCYTMMNMTDRLELYPEIAMRYRKEGFEIGELFIRFLEKKSFAKIESREAQELILTNARFAAVMYENMIGDRKSREDNLKMLREALAISEDPFYTEGLKDFDWRYYRYRVLNYFAQLTDLCNLCGFEEDLMPEILERSEEFWEFWHSDPEFFSELEKESFVEFQRLRNRYYAKKISNDTYLDGLLTLYHDREMGQYDVSGIIENIQIPTEILGLVKKDRYTEKEKALITTLYNNVIAYAFHIPNSGVLSFMLEQSTYFMRHFIELPGELGFEEMMLDFLAAMHPPTYVHSRMVARFSVCLCDHLIDMEPELLIGVEGCKTREEVLLNRNQILEYTWHAALCHDTGKIFIIDTVFVYGRKLLDMEFDLIKTHPKMGADMLKRFSSTKKYADVALGHHKWYDNTRGYPEDFDTSKSPVKTVIDLVLCADCLDAATDTVGRSYNRGKTFDDYYTELKEGSGTRYAPWLVTLFSRPGVREDIDFLLTEGRDQNYHDTYLLLKSVQEKEKS